MPEITVENGFKEFHERNYRMVYRVCFTYMKDKPEAEDCAKDVFVKVLTGKFEFNDDSREEVADDHRCKSLQGQAETLVPAKSQLDRWRFQRAGGVNQSRNLLSLSIALVAQIPPPHNIRKLEHRTDSRPVVLPAIHRSRILLIPEPLFCTGT